MNFRYCLGMAAVGLALHQPVAAQERDAFEKFEATLPEDLFKGILREDDISLLLRHLRDSMVATVRGEEVHESEAMKRRAEQIQRDVAVRGTVLMGALLSAVELAATQAIREVMSDLSSGNSRARAAQPSGGPN